MVLISEVIDEATFIPHHKKKLVFIFSAMRHFALDLKNNGFNVIYNKLNDSDNTGSLTGEISRLMKNQSFEKIVITSPSEFRVLKEIELLSKKIDIPVDILIDDRFFVELEDFKQWALNKKQLRMENFYREQRKKNSILMCGTNPVGGQWNFDSDNRKPFNSDLKIPAPFINSPDEITKEVMEMVSNFFPKHFGDIEPFNFAVNRHQALNALKLFLEDRLLYFGDFQDAMLQEEPWMFHSHISFYLNCGLLLPKECVHEAQKLFYEGKAPLNSVEGFIRQILGWREFLRGIYWLKMPEYLENNFFEVTRNLPQMYWTGETKMNCLSQCVNETKKNAYAHHIQRLMVLGNFALISGIDPKQVNHWFYVVYADAYEWVELPNVSGMILFADGGLVATKPYASTGSYINKMSNYCENCEYKVSIKNGPEACPFNYLYWDFLDRNREKLSSNFRMTMMYKTYDRMDESKKTKIREDTEIFLKSIDY
ncbi:MAG: cryptochrome/photolyase family protein [Gammaproteobacteria bacterium]|nr:cryptochrome/photolyase family protein [Gammaproteobacteria bacterium]